MQSGTERDISGVPTVELKAVMDKYSEIDLDTLAARLDVDKRDLGRITGEQYTFTGLNMADKICHALELNLSQLVDLGELHIVPARDSMNAAMRIATAWQEERDILLSVEAPTEEQIRELELLEQDAPTEEEMQAHALELLELRRSLCVPSEEQRERLRRDSERSNQRQKRERSTFA